MEVNVIVVPELQEYLEEFYHDNKVWISAKLGRPQLEENNAKYLAPFWLTDDRGVNRIFEIEKMEKYEEAGLYVITLGNSYKLEKSFLSERKPRRFEYHPLSAFGVEEGQGATLLPIK